ncbi:carboxylesterase family protein [Niveomyces insectorum RCEF 264]|uniref:Carboxylesterase family protein n=1 Tax=Niveomyces insectorum RCEF 264 TaxID=1081102 RepID=A0A167Z9I1_9HYPO|nr:carboxylesterase family protein [Niveomyces insectorum RCEF 264]
MELPDTTTAPLPPLFRLSFVAVVCGFVLLAGVALVAVFLNRSSNHRQNKATVDIINNNNNNNDKNAKMSSNKAPKHSAFAVAAADNDARPPSGLPPPRVSLPQGTYEGYVVGAGQNVIEAAGLGLGVGAGGGGGGARPSFRSLPSPPQPPQQMALPKLLDAFLGIPYAQTTAGVNRFRMAVPIAVDERGAAAGSRGVISAKTLGQRCPGTVSNPFVPEGEDCLNLNVYRPRRTLLQATSNDNYNDNDTKDGNDSNGTATSKPWPVVVYVHGGGFNNGMGVERDMASFVGYAGPDIVGVSFNYRVGALGFLGWTGDDDDAPLNLGLWDQQTLFAWVRANIGHFGGDADNITIMGLSAGAHSIGHHLLYYPPGAAPFHKAIMESGAPTARAIWYPDHPRPRAQLREFLVAAGVFPAGDAGSTSSTATTAAVTFPRQQDILPRLRALPLARLVAASRAVWNAYQRNVCWPFQPVVDGRLVRDLPLRTWHARQRQQPPGHRVASVPVLTGFDSNEGTLFVPGDRAHADTDAAFRSFFATLVPTLTSGSSGSSGEGDLDALSRLYPDPVTDPSRSPYVLDPHAMPPGVTGRQWARLEAAYAHYAYICPVLQTAQFLAGGDDVASPSSSSSSSSSPPPAPSPPTNPPVYVYEYAAHATALNAANHGDNQGPVAHSMAVVGGHPGLVAVADAMHAAWVQFAVSPAGDPNGGVRGAQGVHGVTWAPFSNTAAGPVMVFGRGNDERVPAAQRRGGPAPKPGIPAAVRSLTPFERAQCRFWWARAALSEGYGQRADDGGGSWGGKNRGGAFVSRL